MSINWLMFLVQTGSVLCDVGTQIQNVCILKILVASHAHVTFTAEARVHSSSNPY